MKSSKMTFIFLQFILVIFSLLLIKTYHPVKKGWWIFEYTEYYIQYFIGFAFIISSFYMLLITIWYNNSDNSFNLKISLKALIICGSLSIIACIYIFYPIWYKLAFTLQEKGWWIFKSKELIAKDPFLQFLEVSGAIAGPIEEFSKLLFILLIPSIRKSIKNRKTGVFYVSMCAFGFALIENIFYFTPYQEVLILRINPAHAVFSAIWGKALGDYFHQKISAKTFLKYLFGGMGLHSLWNYFANFHIILFLILFIIVSFYGLVFIRKQLKFSESS